MDECYPQNPPSIEGDLNATLSDETFSSGSSYRDRLIVYPSSRMSNLAESMIALLQSTGKQVTLFSAAPSESEPGSSENGERLVVLALSFLSEADSHCREVDRIVDRQGGSWVRAVMNDSYEEFQIGPSFRPGSVPCYECAVNGLSKPSVVAARSISSIDEVALCVFMSLSAEVACRAYSSDSLRGGEFITYHLPERLSRRGTIIRRRRCQSCGGTSQTKIPSEYQQAIEMMQDYFNMATSKLKKNQPLGIPGSLSNQLRSIPSYNRKLIWLPYTSESGFSRHQKPFWAFLKRGVPSPSLAELACLLRYTVGRRAAISRDFSERRWCPSAGNKGSVGLQIEVFGPSILAEGAYLYREDDHALERLSHRAASFYEVVASPPNRLRNCGSINVKFLGDYTKLSDKYGRFAAKLVCLDIGVSVAQFLRCADEFRISTQFRLATVVPSDPDGLDKRKLRVGAFVSIIGNTFLASSNSIFEMKEEPIAELPTALYNKSNLDAIEQYILSHEYARARQHASPPTKMSDVSQLARRDNQAVGYRAGTFAETLMNRRSVRSFSRVPIQKETILGLLGAALTRFQIHVGTEISRNVALLLSVENVDDVVKGLYYCFLNDGKLKLEIQSIQVQQGTGDAPAFRCVAMSWAVGEQPVRHCTYSQKLVLAGMLIHFIALETVTRGLAGSIIGRGHMIRDLVTQLETKEDLILCGFVGGLPVLKDRVVPLTVTEYEND